MVDGEELGQGKEKKLGVGMKIKFGDDSEWQVRHTVLIASKLGPYTACLHKSGVLLLRALVSTDVT